MRGVILLLLEMPAPRPTLSELVTRSRADFRGRLGITGSLLSRAMADVLANTWAGAVHSLHGHIAWGCRQLFTYSSDDDVMLEEGAMLGITPSPALFAAGTTVATGVNGSAILAGTGLVDADGTTFTVIVPAVIAGGIAALAVICDTAGALGNHLGGDTIAFSGVVPGVDSNTTVDSIDGGTDQEAPEQTRARILDFKRSRPTGGGDDDYIAWAKSISGVTRAWVFRHELGLGTVVVRFVTDLAAPIIPTPATVAAVQATLDDEKPLTAEVHALAPVAMPIDFTLLPVPDTAATRDAVTVELEDMITRLGSPGPDGTILISAVRTAIGVSEGVDNYTLTVPAADVVPVVGALPVMGVITWA